VAVVGVAGSVGGGCGQLIMACGTGKTLAAMWIAERLESKRALVLIPSLSLLAQTLREWTANASSPFDYLAVCSDETVAQGDALVQHTSELGLPVTTDPERIAAFLRRRGRRVVFATYQSSPQITAAQRRRAPGFDLAVADEAHRCAGRVGSEFTTILDRELIRAKRRLFMTATPRFYTARVRRSRGRGCGRTTACSWRRAAVFCRAAPGTPSSCNRRRSCPGIAGWSLGAGPIRIAPLVGRRSAVRCAS
jgi:predicted helicase